MRGEKIVIDLLPYKSLKAFGYREYILNLLNGLYTYRENILYKNIILVCHSDEINSFDKFKDKFQIVGFKFSNIISRIIIQNKLFYIFKLKKEDVVIFTGNYSSIIKVCKHLLVIHDLFFLRKEMGISQFMKIQRTLFVPISIILADRIVAISQSTTNEILLKYKTPKQKITTIYNCFDFSKYSSPKYLISEFEYFLSVSSSAKYKNTLTILKAFELYCKSENKNIAHLVLIGSVTPQNEILFNYYNSLPIEIKSKVHLYKNITNSELSGLYINSKAYISATLFEGLGMPIVEALYFKKKMILSDIHICHEVSMNMAYFFNPLSINELANIMQRIDDIPLIITDEMYNIFLQRYSDNYVVGKYIDTINLLV